MHIDKVSYQRLYPIGSYLNERIGFEASLEEGEDPCKAIEELRILADQSHKPLQEGEVLDHPPINGVKWETKEGLEDEVPIPKNAPREVRINRLLKQMSTCKDATMLKQYHLIVAKEPELQSFYNKKMEEFV